MSRCIVPSIIPIRDSDLTSRKAQRLYRCHDVVYRGRQPLSRHLDACKPLPTVIAQGPVIWPLPMAYETIKPLIPPPIGSGHFYTESPCGPFALAVYGVIEATIH